MPFSAIQKYTEHLPRRQAEMRMMMAEAAMLPHIEQDERMNWMENVMKLIGVEAHAEAQVATPGVLKLIGIQVNKVK